MMIIITMIMLYIYIYVCMYTYTYNDECQNAMAEWERPARLRQLAQKSGSEKSLRQNENVQQNHLYGRMELNSASQINVVSREDM